jgi:hypothetical protein
LLRRSVVIFLDFTRQTGHEHPHLRAALVSYKKLLREMGKTPSEIEVKVKSLTAPPNQ